jgi:proteasome lid subunit RPN8/RPN11
MSRSKAPRAENGTAGALVLTPHQLAAIVRHAEAAYPDEACGLIVGRRRRGGVLVTERIVESANLATGDSRRRFEVDPALRLTLERKLRGTGEAVIGHYHSHPDHPARPSGHDLASAYEPELAWLIVAVEDGRARACGAFRLERDTNQSTALELRLVSDRGPARRPKPRKSSHKAK